MAQLEDLQDEVIAIKARLDALESAPATAPSTTTPDDDSSLDTRVTALEVAVFPPKVETPVEPTDTTPTDTTEQATA